MRHAMILALLAIVVALPTSADARHGVGIFQSLTAPLRIVTHRLGGRRIAHRAPHYRAASVRHHRRVAASLPRTIQVSGLNAAAARNTGAPAPEQRHDGANDRSAAWAGTLYWPSAADDLFDYVLRPASAGAGFWARGPHDLIEAMFARSETKTRSDAACESGGDVQRWRDEVARWRQPSEAERRTVDDLGSALTAAAHAIRTACPAAGGTAQATQRLDAMTDRLWAIRQGATLLRTPIEELAAASRAEKPRATDAVSERREDATATVPAAPIPGCSEQAAAMPWPGDGIERRVRPTNEQRQSLQALQMTVQGMAPMLAATCPTEAPSTPLKRLDAAEKRLNAMLYATRVLVPALHGFYDSLSPEQRSAFDALGRGSSGIPAMARGER